MTTDELREKFRLKRAERRLSFYAVELQCGVTASTLCRFERGKNEPSEEHREAIEAWVRDEPVAREDLRTDEARIAYLRKLGFVWRKPE